MYGSRPDDYINVEVMNSYCSYFVDRVGVTSGSSVFEAVSNPFSCLDTCFDSQYLDGEMILYTHISETTQTPLRHFHHQ